MKRLGGFKDIEVPALNGVFDARSAVGQIGFGNYQVVLNLDSTDSKSRCRLGGWAKLLGDSPYGFANQDFHDQMIDCATYRQAFDQSIFIPAGLDHYAYPYQAPASDTPTTILSESAGPFSAYAQTALNAYSQSPSPGSWYICNIEIADPVDLTSEVYWNPDWNIPELVVPVGSVKGGSEFEFESLAVPQTSSWTKEFIGTKEFSWKLNFESLSEVLCVNNSNAPGKVPFVGMSSNPSTDYAPLTTGIIDWWKEILKANLVASRAQLGLTVTAIAFYWEWIPTSPSSGWNIIDLYNSGQATFSCYKPAGWTLAAIWAESEVATVSNAGLSTYTLCNFTLQPGVHTDAYQYGDLQPSYHSAYGYNYSYSGDYLYTRSGCRETINMLYEASSISGDRKFLIGTKSKIAVLNERAGSWRLLADGLGGPYSDSRNCGCPTDRWKTAQLGNIVLFTNDIDPVLSWVMDSGPSGCDDWSVDYVQDLLALEIRRAKVVASWRGFVFVANIEQNGRRYSNRIIWSDYNSPLSWFPLGNTLAFTQDLADGDRVVAMETIGQQLRIYTRRGANQTAIYDVMVTGGETTFTFQEVYRGPDGLQYENSMVNRGDVHNWLSESGLMELGPYDRTPIRIEWMHRASGVIYEGLSGTKLGDLAPFALTFDNGDWTNANGFGAINKNACDAAIGFYDSKNKALWCSWPTGVEVCPNMSLRFNLQYQTAGLVDHGFTAGCMMRPNYSQSVRDFMAEFVGCDPESFLVSKEGWPYSFPSAITPPAYIRNETEDPDLPVDQNSICANVGQLVIDDLCAGCDAHSILVMASAQDRTLKQFSEVSYYRERYVGGEPLLSCPYTTDGVYVNDGYFSVLQSDSDDYKQKEEKEIRRAQVDFVALDQVPASQLSFDISYGAQPRCMTWDTSAADRELKCLTSESAAEHQANNTRASSLASYNFFRRGAFIGWRAYTSGTGGGSCWNKVALQLRNAQGEWR